MSVADIDQLKGVIIEDKSTDSSYNTNVISDDLLKLNDKHDIIERPVSNPFDGEKITDEIKRDELLNIFQGTCYIRLLRSFIKYLKNRLTRAECSQLLHIPLYFRQSIAI